MLVNFLNVSINLILVYEDGIKLYPQSPAGRLLWVGEDVLKRMGAGKEEQKKKADSLGRLILGKKGYRPDRLLGNGAFSRVYYVEGKDGRGYACKVSENARLLEQEAQVMAVLEYTLFPKYFGFWREAGLGFLLCEYIPGCTMEEMLARRERFTIEQTVRTGLELTEGLKYLHERPEHFLFRDVKPANIMIRQDGRVKLIDFGCVCSMKERISSRAGTPDFAAPEQLEGNGELTPACDVYGLGRTLEAMLGAGENFRFREKTVLHLQCFSGKKHVLVPRHGSAESMAGRKKRKQIVRFLDACTRREAAERISDMEQVSLALGRFAAKRERLQ